MISYDYTKELLYSIATARTRKNGRALRRKSRKLEKKVQRGLEEQKRYVIQKTKKFAKEKGLSEQIDRIFAGLPDKQMIKDIIFSAGDAMTFGALSRIKESRLGDIGITFDLDHPEAEKYLKTSRPLVLAKMKDTVKEHIKPILIRGIEQGISPLELAKEISENFAFSKSRSLMIATNEIGTAYGKGNFIVMQDVEKEGYKAKKKWSTTGDDRVTDECRSNGGQGWIKLKKNFNSGDDFAPRSSHPRCRCDTLYTYK